jgi:VanZ family protein
MRRLLVLLVVLIGYGSFFPFSYVPYVPTFDDLGALTTWPARVSLTDALGNIALFFPLGVVIGAGARSFGGAILGWMAASVYAAIIQYVQFWFPSRVPSGSDMVFNILGCAVGTLLGAFLRSVLSQREGEPRNGSQSKVWIPLTLVLLWVIYRWFPLVPTLDVQNVKNALKPLLRDRTWSVTATAHDIVAWLLWFRLCRYAFRDALPLIACIAFACFIVSLEPLFYLNTLSVNTLFGLVGACLISFLFWRGERSLTALLALSGAVILTWSVLPLDLDAPPRAFGWLPLSGLLQGSLVVNVAALIEKLFLYGAWVYLALYRGWPRMAVGVAATLTLFASEWAQRWSPQRTPEVTDPLLAFMCWFVLLSSVSKKFTNSSRVLKKRDGNQGVG